jgi:long-chain fatty acid transport protein
VRAPARAAIVAAVLFATSLCSASPEDIFGFGPRSAAMGETGAASSRGWEAVYANPALLSRVRSNVLAVGLQGAAMDLRADGPGLPGRVSTPPAKGVLVGAEVPVPFGAALRDRVALGLAFYAPSDTLVRARILNPETPQFPLFADRAQSLALRMGAGADIGYGLHIGGGFAALAALVGSIGIASAGGNVSSRVEDQLVATYAPALGIVWDLPLDRAPDGARRWRVGASWRGALEARVGVTVDASKLSTLSLPPFNIAGVAQYDPEETSLEVARDDAGWVFAAGVTWKRWSAYPGPLEPTIVCPSGQECSSLTPPRIAFSDTLAPRVGAERTIALARGAALRVRAGFLVEPTPVPRSLPPSQAYDAVSQSLTALPTRFFDATRCVFALGAGVDLGELAPISLDVFAQWHALASARTETPPAAPASVSGSALAWGLTVAVRF